MAISEARANLLRAEWNAGTVVKVICERVGLTKAQVHYYRRELKLPTRYRTKTMNISLIGFMVNRDLHAKIEGLAVKAGLTKGEWLRRIVMERIKAEQSGAQDAMGSRSHAVVGRPVSSGGGRAQPHA